MSFSREQFQHSSTDTGLQPPSSSISPSELRRLIRNQLHLFVEQGTLTDNQRIVMEQRFALDEEARHRSYTQIASVLHVTRERVRQIQMKALRRLRMQSAFIDLMNSYLTLVPYPKAVKPDTWLTPQGLLETFPTHQRKLMAKAKGEL